MDVNYAPVPVRQLFLHHIWSFCSSDVQSELPELPRKIQQEADHRNRIGQ